MSQKVQQRASFLRQYSIYRLKIIEVTHLMLLTYEISAKGYHPENELGHEAKHFSDSMLTATVTQFMTLVDEHRDGTNVLRIWCSLFSQHDKAIQRIWNRHIEPGRKVMLQFRDSAGAHADKPSKYFQAKLALVEGRAQVIRSLDAFIMLSAALMRRESRELADLQNEIETMLLEIELSQKPSFNRRWLREWLLIESGPYHKSFG